MHTVDQNNYYHMTAQAAPSRPPLGAGGYCDVVVVGAGLAGLTATLELARQGRQVCLLEAEQVGWGASGRNGGFVAPGYANSYQAMRRMAGDETANELFRLSIDALPYIRRNIEQFAAESTPVQHGIMGALRYDDQTVCLKKQALLAQQFDYQVDYFDRYELASFIDTNTYYHGVLDRNAFHIHPLNYALSIADEIERLGGLIFEKTPLVSYQKTAEGIVVTTPHGTITCEKLLLSPGGYTTEQLAELHRAMLPINTYVMVTEPVDDSMFEQSIKRPLAVLDDRRASDYYRRLADGRILWGGRITTQVAEPKNLAQLLKQDMVSVYPSLASVKVAYAWSGLMSYARHMMPQIGQLEENVWHCTAFGGHGLNTTAVGGRLMAAAIGQGDDRYRLFSPFKLTWNGGRLGRVGVQGMYTWYQLCDRWRERRW